MRRRIAHAARAAGPALLALPAAGAAHPGHDHAGLLGGALHHVLELAVIVAVVGLAVAGLRRLGRAGVPRRR